MSGGRLLLAVALLSAALTSPDTGGATVTLRRPLNARLWETDLKPDSLRLRLPDRWVIPGSLLLTIEGETLRVGADYEIESSGGVIRLLRAAAGGRLRARYDVVPLGIGRVFQQPIPLDTAGAAPAPLAPREDRLGEIASRARLDLRGTKTVSLEVGSSEDLTLRQSLDVSLSGQIVPGVTVRGVLSDRETPLQAEGRTTEISDVDRVYLQVDGPGASMTLGDFTLRGPPGLFTGYQRQLEGISLRGEKGTVTAGVAAATVPGRFTSVEFLAAEGKQGPYALLGNQGSLEGVIQAGSERVWLDGDLLVRGEDRDYVIDYAAGTLSFTGRRLVGKDSRVTVDFQANVNPYRRNVYSVDLGWGASAPDRAAGSSRAFSLRAGFVAERDDASRPTGGALSEAERGALEQAGDSLTTGLTPGIDCGSQGHGDYEWVEADSLAFPFLRYAGAGVGTCRVRFEDAGEGKGDYADSLLTDGMTVYRYVGLRRGRFLPGRTVARPSERDLASLLASLSGPAGLRLEAEGAGSLDDPNILSPKDDGDRTGGALRLMLAREAQPVRIGSMGIGRWGVRLESRDLERTFRPVGRIDPGWLGYDWGIAEGRLDRGERKRSAALRHEPGLGFALNGSYETLSNRSDLEGKRSSLALRRVGRIHAALERTRVSTTDRAGGPAADGRRSVDGGAVGLQLPWIENTLGYRRDRVETDSTGARAGSGFDEWRATLAHPLGSDRGRLEGGFTRRVDRALDVEGWRKGDEARTWEARALWTPPGRLLDGRYARRGLRARGGGRSRSDVAGLIWSEDRADGRFGQQLKADLNTTESESRVKSIQYVGAGAGHYDSFGAYVGQGDYDVVLLPTGARSLQRRLDMTWRIELAPGRGMEASAPRLFDRVWQSSQWLFQSNFSSRTTGSAAAFWEDLPQLLLARRRGVPLAQHRIRGEASFLPQARWLSPQIRAERERSEAQAYENVQTRRESDLLSFTLRSTPWRNWTLEQEFERNRDEEIDRLLGDSPLAGRIGWRSMRVRLAETWRPRSGWTLRLASIARARERIPSGTAYEIYQLAPGVQWLPRERSRIDLQVTRTWVRGPEGRLLGLEQAGWEGRCNLGVRLRRWLDASLVADLRAPAGGTTRVNARSEMRAFF